MLFLFVNDLIGVRIFTEFCRKLQHLEFFRTRKKTLVITLNIKGWFLIFQKVCSLQKLSKCAY